MDDSGKIWNDTKLPIDTECYKWKDGGEINGNEEEEKKEENVDEDDEDDFRIWMDRIWPPVLWSK